MKRALPVFISIFIVVCGFASYNAVRPEIYFTDGETLSFVHTIQNGTKTYSDVKILSVETQDGRTTITAKEDRLNDQHKFTLSFRKRYWCDSVNWCVDALSHLSIPLVYSSNFTVDLDSDSLVYPFRMKAGDTLPPAFAKEIIHSGGDNERSMRYINRKVMREESITIAGETMKAFVIESRLIHHALTDYGQLGKIPYDKEYKHTEWFVPSKGVVKSRSESDEGVNTAELTAWK